MLTTFKEMQYTPVPSTLHSSYFQMRPPDSTTLHSIMYGSFAKCRSSSSLCNHRPLTSLISYFQGERERDLWLHICERTSAQDVKASHTRICVYGCRGGLIGFSPKIPLPCTDDSNPTAGPPLLIETNHYSSSRFN